MSRGSPSGITTASRSRKRSTSAASSRGRFGSSISTRTTPSEKARFRRRDTLDEDMPSSRAISFWWRWAR
jgi:hypothetical protein